jgi:hypothetical protein
VTGGKLFANGINLLFTDRQIKLISRCLCLDVPTGNTQKVIKFVSVPDVTNIGVRDTPADVSGMIMLQFHGGAHGIDQTVLRISVFCDIKTHFVLHRRHITSPLQSPAS